jgi:hypothetical protein
MSGIYNKVNKKAKQPKRRKIAQEATHETSAAEEAIQAVQGAKVANVDPGRKKCLAVATEHEDEHDDWVVMRIPSRDNKWVRYSIRTSVLEDVDELTKDGADHGVMLTSFRDGALLSQVSYDVCVKRKFMMWVTVSPQNRRPSPWVSLPAGCGIAYTHAYPYMYHLETGEFTLVLGKSGESARGRKRDEVMAVFTHDEAVKLIPDATKYELDGIYVIDTGADAPASERCMTMQVDEYVKLKDGSPDGNIFYEDE